MSTSTKKTISASLPAHELAALDRVRERQNLSRAEAIREAIRWYVGALGNLPPAEDPLPDEVEAIRQGRQQFERGEYVRLEDLQHELGLRTR